MQNIINYISARKHKIRQQNVLSMRKYELMRVLAGHEEFNIYIVKE